jgi:DNA polymerase-3 subunit gamma/tau
MIAYKHFAKILRPKTFDEVIGQDLVVRMVKNSIYKNRLFPVYLLAGQRGCGKTTMGRLIAQAVNCQARDTFMNNPQTVLPCGACYSCISYKEGKHPDITEIDAASYTGVDTIRQILEHATLLPVIGSTKVYLIDEAHMLSKAACNALLKILEEPSPHLLFLLATTEPDRIIDTIRSRCFLLSFFPITTPVLFDYLKDLCLKEQVAYDQEGLNLIIRASQGSVRDALTLLERVILAYNQVNQQEVSSLLSMVTTTDLYDLLRYIGTGNQPHILNWCTKMASNDPCALWRSLVEVMRQLLWAWHGTAPTNTEVQELKNLFTYQQYLACTALLYEYEQKFIKSSAQWALLEYLVCAMADCATQKNIPQPCITHNDTVKKEAIPRTSGPEKTVTKNQPITMSTENRVPHNNTTATSTDTTRWSSFIMVCRQCLDPLICSMLDQAILTQQDTSWTLTIPTSLIMFETNLMGQQVLWQKVFGDIFGHDKQVKICFEERENNQQHFTYPIAPAPSTINTSERTWGSLQTKNTTQQVKNTMYDTRKKVSVEDIGQQGKEILERFAGNVYEVTSHE